MQHRGNRGLALGVLFVYWCCVNYLVLHAPFDVFSVPEEGAVHQLTYLSSDESSPDKLPADNWQTIKLPHDWYLTKPPSKQLWYRISLDIDPQKSDIWGIYLPSISHNAAVYINNVWIGQGGSFSEPVSRHHNEPLLFSFSANLLKQGVNNIELRVKASYLEQGFLGKVYLAPLDQLQRSYYWKKLIRVDFILWMTIAIYIMASVVMSFWLARRKDTIYGLFSLELFFWATHNLNLFVADIPTSARFWEAMTMSTLGWTVLTMIIFNHRYVGENHPKIDRVAMVIGVLGLGLFLLPDVESILHIGYKIWDTLLILFGSYTMIFLLRNYWRTQNTDVYLMLLVGVPMLVFGLHDILLVNHYIDRSEGLIIQYSVVPAALLFSWFLVRRFVQSINKAENLAETLELRVQEKQKEIHIQYEQLKTMEKESVLAEERERIMRDMHDGIGGQLVSTIVMLQNYQGEVYGKVRHKIQSSLTDLRFVIDSLDPLLNDLPTLLGMMRMRLLDQFEAADIDLEWAVTDLPELQSMSPRHSLHIMRIVQEAMTNSMKHAATQKMKLSTGTLNQQRQVFIDIEDYGRGFDTSLAQKQGRGVKNMYYRAQQLGAQINIYSSDQGTRVRLLMDARI